METSKYFAIMNGEIVLIKCATCGQKLKDPKYLDSFYLSMTKRFTKLETIMHLMNEKYGITYQQLRVRRRTYGLVKQRQIFYKLAAEFTDCSYPMIGRFVNRDHTTVLKGLDVKLDSEYDKIYRDLREYIMEHEVDVAIISSA